MSPPDSFTSAPSDDRSMVLGNFLGNNSRRLPPSDAVSTPSPVTNKHVKPNVAVPTNDGGHVSSAVVGLDRGGSTRSGWQLFLRA